MSNTIKKNIKSTITNSIEAPAMLLDVSAEVVSDAAKLTTGVIRNAVPVTKAVLGALTVFGVALFNSDKSNDEILEIKDSMSVEAATAGLQNKSISAAKAIVSMWDDLDDVVDTETK